MMTSEPLSSSARADGEHLLLAARQLGAAVAATLGEAREQLVDGLGRPALAARLAGEHRRCSSTVSDGNSRRPWGT